MQPLHLHISLLIGLVAFVNQLVRFAPLDRTIIVGVGSGMAVYVVLVFGDLIVKKILTKSPQQEEGGTEKESAPDPAKHEPAHAAA